MPIQSVFEGIQTACFYRILMQQIPNFINTDLKKL